MTDTCENINLPQTLFLGDKNISLTFAYMLLEFFRNAQEWHQRLYYMKTKKKIH